MTTPKQPIPILSTMGMAALGLAQKEIHTNNGNGDDDFWNALSKDSQKYTAATSMEKTLRGMQRYISLKPRLKTPRKKIWQNGEIKLLHIPSKNAKSPRGVVLLIPSLINSYEIMDLMRGRSFAEFLAAQNFDVLIIDWGDLAADDTLQSFEKIITVRLQEILEIAQNHALEKPLIGVGYCMGGILLGAAEILNPKTFKALSFIATPFDCLAGAEPNFGSHLRNFIAQEGLTKLNFTEFLPQTWLQMLFQGIDPIQIAHKFSAFADMEDEITIETFARVEDWLNSGSSIPSPLMVEAADEWYNKNALLKNEWKIGGKVLDFNTIKTPSHITVPLKDKIVPPESALALRTHLPHAEILKTNAGHISLMMGRNAADIFWNPFLNWLTKNF